MKLSWLAKCETCIYHCLGVVLDRRKWWPFYHPPRPLPSRGANEVTIVTFQPFNSEILPVNQPRGSYVTVKPCYASFMSSSSCTTSPLSCQIITSHQTPCVPAVKTSPKLHGAVATPILYVFQFELLKPEGPLAGCHHVERLAAVSPRLGACIRVLEPDAHSTVARAHGLVVLYGGTHLSLLLWK